MALVAHSGPPAAPKADGAESAWQAARSGPGDGGGRCHGDLPGRVRHAPGSAHAPHAARLQGPPVRVRMRCQAKAEKQLHGKTNADHVHLIFVKSITNDLLIFKKEK